MWGGKAIFVKPITVVCDGILLVLTYISSGLQIFLNSPVGSSIIGVVGALSGVYITYKLTYKLKKKEISNRYLSASILFHQYICNVKLGLPVNKLIEIQKWAEEKEVSKFLEKIIDRYEYHLLNKGQNKEEIKTFSLDLKSQLSTDKSIFKYFKTITISIIKPFLMQNDHTQMYQIFFDEISLIDPFYIATRQLSDLKTIVQSIDSLSNQDKFIDDNFTQLIYISSIIERFEMAYFENMLITTAKQFPNITEKEIEKLRKSFSENTKLFDSEKDDFNFDKIMDQVLTQFGLI